MPAKDPGFWESMWAALQYLWPWLTTLVLGTMATAAQYAAKVRAGEPFSWRSAALDWVICIFAAIVMHLICEYYGMDGLVRSILVAISAHSGTRSMMLYERWRDRALGLESER